MRTHTGNSISPRVSCRYTYSIRRTSEQPNAQPIGPWIILYVLIALVLFAPIDAVAFGGDDESLVRAASNCSGDTPQLPLTIDADLPIRAEAAAMLRASATFREQCRRLTEASWLRMVIRRSAKLSERSFRARSVIQRARAGQLLVSVELSPHGSMTEWISHEFEHVLEQLDGVRLPQLAAVSGRAWRTSDGMFETERAIRAGRTVIEEIRRFERRGNKLVE